MLHVVWCILCWGPCRNFDTAIGETNHKWLAKKPAKTAQKSLKTFEIQSAGNLFDQYVVSRAMHEFLRIGGMEENFMKFFPADVPKEDLTADDSISDDFQTGRSEFEIEQKYMHGIAYACRTDAQTDAHRLVLETNRVTEYTIIVLFICIPQISAKLTPTGPFWKQIALQNTTIRITHISADTYRPVLETNYVTEYYHMNPQCTSLTKMKISGGGT